LQCERCLGIEAGSEVDVVEIDAASHTSVDNVRDLKEQVAYAPMRARYKVWIIDEVHMLSKSAFNAFLKTLEEPPPHVKFLFATTDPQKVLETVLSRVQVLKLSPLTEATIAARLTTVFEREGIHAEHGVVEEIARRARGGMRDALSLADQLLSLVGTKPTLADAKALSVDSGGELVDRVLDAVLARDRAGVLNALPHGEGGEAELLGALMDAVRAHLVLGLLGADAQHVQLDTARRAAVVARAKSLGLERLQIILEELLLARERAGRMPMHARVVLESTLLDLARGDGLVPLQQIVERLSLLEARLAGAVSSKPDGAVRVAAARPVPASAPAVAPASTHAPTPPASVPRSVPPLNVPSLTVPPLVVPPHVIQAPPPVVQAQPPGVLKPQPPQATATLAPPRPVRGALSGTQDAYARLVEDLQVQHPQLGVLFAERGKLLDLDARRVVIGFKLPRESEKPLLANPETKAVCKVLLTKILGREVEVYLQDASSMKGKSDEWTERVARLFEGRVEDGA
jgi:DNA polymerase-3 subunit gamma/tau